MKKSIFALCLAAAFGAVAGTITETTEDMTALGDWTIDVAAGDSNVVTVAQSGSGKIIKTGGGYLVLRKNSTFTGGVEIQGGFVTVDPDADAGTSGTVNCTALGTGDVTILGQRSGYEGYCELGIVGAGSNDTRIVTIANKINVTGNTTGKYPALVFYGQNSVLTGKITAAQDFVFWDEETSTRAISNALSDRYSKVQSATLGAIEATGTIGYRGACRFVMAGKVTTPLLDLTITRTTRGREQSSNQNNAHGALVFMVANSIGKIVSTHTMIYCQAKNVLPGIHLCHKRTESAGSANYLYMRGFSPETGYTQTIGGLESDPLYDGQKNSTGSITYGMALAGKSSKTLTITGIAPEEGQTSRELVTCTKLNGAMNVTLDAYDGFTQTVSNQSHSISGTISAKKGTFRVAGTANFASLTGITVDEGATFDVRTTTAKAFKDLTALTVNGTLSVSAAAVNAFDGNRADMSIGANATLSLPSGMTLTVHTLKVDGVTKLPGTYTRADVPALSEGATLNVMTVAEGVTAEWSGAADDLMATMANWKDTPESLPLNDYSLGVTITNNGTEMVYADGTKINNIMFRRTPAAVPFTIRPATPGAVLEVAGRIELLDAAQLILKDAIIAPPSRIDQGAASDSDTAMFLKFQGNSDVTTYAASNNVYKTTKNNLPLVLDNAVIEKPLYMTAHITGHTCIYCMPGSTNEIRGNFNHATYQPDVVVPANTMITFSGGVSYGTTLHKTSTGTMVVTGKPITSTTWFQLEAGKLILDVENMSLRGSVSGDGMNLSGGTLDCRRSYCFNGESGLTFRGSSLCTVEFNSTTQRVTRLCGLNSNATSKIHGDPGSLLEFVGGWGSGRSGPSLDENRAMYGLFTNCVDIAGALSLKLSATNETMTFYSKAFSTCGDLEVSAGTLDFKSDATWLNGTNIAVNGVGRIKVANGGTFTGKFSSCRLRTRASSRFRKGKRRRSTMSPRTASRSRAGGTRRFRTARATSSPGAARLSSAATAS